MKSKELGGMTNKKCLSRHTDNESPCVLYKPKFLYQTFTLAIKIFDRSVNMDMYSYLSPPCYAHNHSHAHFEVMKEL